MARLFITHGGQNSLMQAVYHAVPVLAIPLFGDQFDNVVRAEAKGLGLAVRTTHITREVVSSTIQTIIHDVRYAEVRRRVEFSSVCPCWVITHLPLLFSNFRFKEAALSLSRIHRSHPLPPTLRLIRWVEHILQSGGGAHLKPASQKQTWYQRCLLDVALLLTMVLLALVFLCWAACKSKCSKKKHQKTQ